MSFQICASGFGEDWDGTYELLDADTYEKYLIEIIGYIVTVIIGLFLLVSINTTQRKGKRRELILELRILLEIILV